MKIILLGPPGSGKGTVAKKMQIELGIPVISTGVILREAIDGNTELGKKVKSIMSKGELVPDYLIMKIIRERVEQKDCKNGYIFDGFPRNIEQARSLEKLNSEHSEQIDYIFYFEIPFSEIIQRLSSRRVCKKCSTNYNLLFKPPREKDICDLCGGDLYQREDDKAETVKNRLKVYEKQTLPLKNFYKEKEVLITLDANSSKNAFLEILKKLEGKKR